MATIDDRVVAMSFENKRFEQGVGQTLSSLDKLKNALNFRNAGKGLESLTAASKKTDLSHISNSVDQIRNKFSAMNAAATAVIFNLTNRIVNAGSQMAKSFTVAPLLDGFHEYENQIKSVQTILANTKAAGTNLKDVNGALDQLNTYADKTIYNFGQMTKNIGTFTAAGVDLETSVSSIKGISNLAAVSGSSAEQAATAMYQLSQAISSGRVSLQDWNSVVNAGMGGTVFQRALAQTAVAMGKIDESSVKLEGKMKNVKIEGESFRNSIMAKPGEESWLTSDVLTNTLKQFSGDLSEAELKAQGFNEAQIKAIRAQAKMALNAATQVKTLSQLLDTTKEAIGSGWAQTWRLVFGDFKEAKTLFTGLAEAISGFVGKSADARNKVLKDWKDLGGRTLLINSLKDAFKALAAILAPIKDAFRDIFPRRTGKDLLEMTKNFGNFAKALMPSEKTIENLRRTFRGLFGILSIGKQLLGGVWEAFKVIFSSLSDGAGSALDLTGDLGDLITKLDAWLKQGNRLKDFFKSFGEILSIPIKIIGQLTSGLSGIFSGGNVGEGLSSAFRDMNAAMKPSQRAIEMATGAWKGFLEVMESVGRVLDPIVDRIGDAFGTIGETIATAFKTNNFEPVFDAVQTGLLGGIFLALRKGLSEGLNIGLAGNAMENISDSLDVLKGSLQSIQNNLRANTLLQIAAAVTLLAISAKLLSKISPEDLAKSMTALAVGMGQLMAGMAVIGKMGGIGISVAAAAGSLILIATAINILVLAVMGLSLLDWEEIARGLAGVSGLLLGLSLSTKALSKAGPGMLIAAASMAALGVGLNIIALAVKIFSTMSWEEIAKGLVGVVLALNAVGVAVRAVPPTVLLIGPGLIAVGITLAAIAGAVKIFGSMDMATLGKGIGAVAVSLLAIAGAMALMPPTLPLTAAGLILVGIGLTAISGAIALMGNMDVATLAKGIIGIGAALAVLAVGLTAMIASLPGAAALLVAAGALAIFVPVLGILGNMEFSTIAKGLGIIVVSLVAIGVAGAIASPGLIALGSSLLILGAGMALVGAAAKLMASAFVKLGSDGGKGVAVVIAALTGMVAILPKVIIDFVKGLVQIAKGIVEIAPQVVASMAKLLIVLLDVVIKAAPKFGQAAIAIVLAMVKFIDRTIPAIIKTGLKLLLALLRGISQNIGRVTRLASDITIKFLNALTQKMPQLTTAGGKFLVALLDGISRNLRKVTDAAFNIIVGFVRAIARNLPRVLTAGVSIVTKFIEGISNNLRKVISTGTTMVVRLLRGVANAGSRIVTAGVDAATKFVNALSREIPRLVNNVANAVIKMLNRLATVVERRTPEFMGAIANIGTALIKGIVSGLDDLGSKLAAKIGDEIKSIPGKTLGKLGDLVAKVASRALQTIVNPLSGLILPADQRAIIEQLFGFGERAGESFYGGLLSGVLESKSAIDQTTDDFRLNLIDQINSTKQNLRDAQVEFRGIVREISANRDIVKKKFKADKDDNAKERAAAKERHKERQKEARERIEDLLKEKLAADKAQNANEELLLTLEDTLKLVEKDTSFLTLKQQLKDNTTEFESLNTQLETARQNFIDLKNEKDNFVKSKFEQFTALPDFVTEDANGNKINPQDQVKNYTKSLEESDDALLAFTDTLGKLRWMGLNDETYKQLLDVGPAAQGFADALLTMGPAAIDAINRANTSLRGAAQIMAEQAGTALYDNMLYVGENSAQGIIDGLEKKKGEIYKKLLEIAGEMVKKIKNKLRIKSPSEMFAEIGRFSVEGMARGFANSSKLVTSAVTDTADNALAAMKKSMQGISEAVLSEIDPNPKITPVLDLSEIQNGSKSLSNMLAGVSASASLGQASLISSAQLATQVAKEAAASESVIKFEQNNYSPESLSEIQIYRQTRNQLSQVKAALAGT